MDFNNATTLGGIVQDTLFRTNTNVNEFSLKDITRFVNEGYNRVAYTILNADGRMQWDDVNHTDQPISVANLIEDQNNYGIFTATPDALQDWLMIDRVEAKDSSGNWVVMTPIDRKDIPEATGEFQDVSGQPNMYDFDGSQLIMYPPTSYASTGGLKIYFNRAPSYFISTDTTKRPGFATIFHQYLSIYAANQWNITKKNDNGLEKTIEKMEYEIGKFYSIRNKVEIPRLSRAYKSYK